MKIKSINGNQNFTSLSALAKPLETFYNANANLPTLAIETGVTLGRTGQAKKRGGKIEATERFIEQGVSAVVWLWGVQILKKAGDFIGKNILNLDLNFDIGKDILRNPAKNNNIKNSAIVYKAGNILTSTVLATYFIGFILPKINRFLTKKINKIDKRKQIKTLNTPTLEEFKNSNKKKDIHFTSLGNVVQGAAHLLENNSTARLLITDSGVIYGRYKNAKNKYKKIEGLFRDISSIYFYLFAMKHTVKGMNQITKNTEINPLALSCLIEELKEKLKETSIEPDEFLNNTIGSIDENSFKTLKELFKNKEVINVETFYDKFEQLEAKAKQMSALQPIFEGEGVLTYNQAKDVLKESWLSDPKFLHKMFNKTTKGVYKDKRRFISKKELEKIRQSLDDFVIMVSNSAKSKKQKIDFAFVEKTANKTIAKNFAFNILGLGISIFALGYLIPKIQYFITKKLTKKDEFPGLDEYK